MGSGDRVPTVEPSEHWMESLVQWASKNHLEAVLAYRPFVGSIHDQVTDLEIQLKAAGVAIVWVEREWDTTWFPYAKKGFFLFWKSAGQQLRFGPSDFPDILDEQGLLFVGGELPVFGMGSRLPLRLPCLRKTALAS